MQAVTLGNKAVGLLFYGMPRYFFHVRHAGLQPDLEGSDLADDGTAWAEATAMVGEMLRDMDGELKPGSEWSLDVANERQDLLFRLRIQAEDCR